MKELQEEMVSPEGKVEKVVPAVLEVREVMVNSWEEGEVTSR
jgi:hypothetical protein